MNIDEIEKDIKSVMPWIDIYPESERKLINRCDALIAMVRALEADNAGLVKAMKKVDAVMSRTENYLHVWTNHPGKPEITPRGIVQSALAKHGGKA